ncbi:MAG: hypothetical protein HY072_01955 [Deltaproteobacteria bacterium]|nr:hypothetical protein [Deltaproteobacteria bacterium]
MPIDSDIVLIGTGIAPLVCASKFLSEGKSVLLLNPDWDFFQENSELPLSPLLSFDKQEDIEEALVILNANYPGSIESWPKKSDTQNSEFHDFLAPHLRVRDQIWIYSNQDTHFDLKNTNYQNCRQVDGLSAYLKFPGHSSKIPTCNAKGVLLPKTYDIDINRYRYGVLDFIKERLTFSNIICFASQIELTQEGIRYHAQNTAYTTKINEGLLVFWTPRLTAWILNQAKKTEVTPLLPRGIRLWEQWSLVSKEPLDPAYIGHFEDLTVWAEVEGFPPTDLTKLHLSVLKSGALLKLDLKNNTNLLAHESLWTSMASAESFQSLAKLCYQFLNWKSFSIRSMQPRAIFEWDTTTSNNALFTFNTFPFKNYVVCGGDGVFTQVIKQTQSAVDILLKN